MSIAQNDPERKSRTEPVPDEQLDDAGRRQLEEYGSVPRTGHAGQIIYPGDEPSGDDDGD